MNDRHIEAILAYLNENAGRYSLEALRAQLLQTGYDPATVDWAIQIHQGNNPAPPKSRTGRKILLVLAVNAVLAAILTGMASIPGVTEEMLSVLGFGFFLLGCAELFGGILLCFFESKRSWGLGLLLGFLLSIGLALLIFAGWCVYALAHQGGNFH
jgi:hypothetical protein